MQIRDGLHVLGDRAGRPAARSICWSRSPACRATRQAAATPRSIAPSPPTSGSTASTRSTATWRRRGTARGPKRWPMSSTTPWRTNGDTVERMEVLATMLVAEGMDAGIVPRRPWNDTCAVLGWIARTSLPPLDRSRTRSRQPSVLAALDGRFVVPGPSGAPTRGRPDVLPTGRNFYSVDIRAVPTPPPGPSAAPPPTPLALRYFQDHGDWPRSIALSAWGTSNMRTGGDDIAQALALIGAEPPWERGTGRVTGFQVMPLAELGRPRIDVTLQDLRLLPRRLSRPDRPVRLRHAGRRRARRARRRQPHRR